MWRRPETTISWALFRPCTKASRWWNFAIWIVPIKYISTCTRQRHWSAEHFLTTCPHQTVFPKVLNLLRPPKAIFPPCNVGICRVYRQHASLRHPDIYIYVCRRKMDFSKKEYANRNYTNYKLPTATTFSCFIRRQENPIRTI